MIILHLINARAHLIHRATVRLIVIGWLGEAPVILAGQLIFTCELRVFLTIHTTTTRTRLCICFASRVQLHLQLSYTLNRAARVIHGFLP